ncbi:MAG: oxidoreductase [Burkholderiales bacterium]|jgi:putative YhdH/YhfP family quinone oxidoreductase|nr:oxidoreductase [Burkholderiales bacterium]
MTKFKAFRLREHERKVTAGFEDMTVDELDPGDVVIRVAYSSVNYKDALAATGAGRIVRRFPCVGGIDLAGTVVESSDGRFAKGDAVLATSYDIGVAHDGGYAEYARIPAGWIVPMPKGLTLHDAMALGTAGFTAGLAVERMEHDGLAPANGPVVVSGATGGVGSIAVDILSRRGYHVVALTGKDTETDYLHHLGAKEVMLRSSLDLAKIKPLDRATWAGAVDNLGGDVLAWMASTMQVGGVIASVGLAASMNLNTTVAPFILRGASLLGVDSANCPMPQRRRVWERLATDLRPAHLAACTRTVPFAELPSVFDAFVQAKVKGRVVVDLAP